jgi:hypothetical protein
MNYCNFAKVIIARCSKDSQSIKWWENKNQPGSEPQSLSSSLANFNNLVPCPQRYSFYQSVMQNHTKMYLSYDAFSKNITRLQSYLTQNKYWKSGNANGEKRLFMQQYSLKSWCALSNTERNLHSVKNCAQCESVNPSVASLHKSISATTENIMLKTESLVQEIKSMTPNRVANASTQMMNILEPIFENNFSISLKNAASSRYNLTEKKSSAEKFKEKVKEGRKSSQNISNLLSNEMEIDTFLSSGTSYNQRDRDRLAAYFETPQAAKQRSEKDSKKVTTEKKKRQKHVGNIENYNFDRADFLKYIKTLPTGAKVSWRNLAIKFNLTNKNGIRPSNGGQVLLEYAKKMGANTHKFNTEKRISGRDYVQRVRRAKQKLYKKISIPTTRPTSTLHKAIQRKLQTKELYIGEKIAPKIYKRNKIATSGKLETSTVQVYGRITPLEKIRQQMNRDQADYFRHQNQGEYQNLTAQHVQQRLQEYGLTMPKSLEEALENLKKTESTRHLKIWHDHSDILNHSYVSFMISPLYDPAIFLTNEEFKQRFPERQPIDVKGAVEKPYLYILGQSKSSDKDQMAYNNIRLEDLRTIEQPTEQNGIEIYDRVRVFSGDGPARQFEAGQQRGGHYSCLCGIKVTDHQNLECAMRFHSPSLQERMSLFKAGVLWKEFFRPEYFPLHEFEKR